MRRILPPLAALLLAACLLGACNSSFSATAARVGGGAISQGTFNEELSAVGSSPGFQCVLTGGGSEPVKGAGAGTYDASFSAQILTTLVEGRVLSDEVSRRSLPAGSFSRKLGLTELQAALAPGQSEDQSILGGLPGRVRDRLVALQADQAVLAAAEAGVRLTAPGVAAWAKAHPKAATLTCLELGVFPSQDAAKRFSSSIGAGKAFAEQAQAAGGQAQSGCVATSALPGGLGSVVDRLPTGKVSAPTSYEGEFLVIQVTSRKVSTGTKGAELLLDSLSSKVAGVVHEALGRASVEVDPAYGTWGRVGSTYQVIPPKGPASGLLVNPSAATASPTAATSGLG